MEDTAVKIRSYSVTPRGNGGVTVMLPQAWVKDMGIKSGDKIVISRDTRDRLILTKEAQAVQS